jgi:hypothetical protein
LVQTQPVSPERPQVADVARFALVASRIAAPYLRARREINEACWSDSARWKFVINFGHPMGRRPFKILMTAYAIGLVGLAMTGAAVVGLRW